MCFYHGDSDWIARVVERDALVSDGTVRCDECGKRIRGGEEYEHLDQREHEECQRCQDEESYRYEACHPACVEGAHDFGEEYQHDTCERCQKFLKAIEAVETDEGCKGDEVRPALGELRDAMWEADGAQAYIDRARSEYPELAMSGYLDTMYARTPEYRRLHEDREQWDEDDIGPVDELGGEG